MRIPRLETALRASIISAVLVGCSGPGDINGQRAHLVIHSHNDLFDIIDPSGGIVKTLNSAEGVLSALEDPTVAALIREETVVFRCQLDSKGLPTGETGELAVKVASIPGVRKVRWEQDEGSTN